MIVVVIINEYSINVEAWDSAAAVAVAVMLPRINNAIGWRKLKSWEFVPLGNSPRGQVNLCYFVAK